MANKAYGSEGVLWPVVMLGCLLLLLCPVCVEATEEAGQPNIIFIMADDLGPEWLGCYGGENIQTPHIDRMAAEGIRFTHAYSMPKCTPTRVALLTGTYPFRNGWVNHWDVPRWGARCHFDPEHYTTFANVLRDAGYRTAIAGKWQINDFRVQPEVLDAHGFDQWCVWTGYETGNPPSAERYWDPYIHTRAGSKTYPDQFGPDVFTDFLIEFLKQDVERPACLYFPMVLPHSPWVTTPHAPDVKGRQDRHIAMTEYIDHLVGRILEAVASQDTERKTLVIFTTDNGSSNGLANQMNGRKVSGGKGKLDESGCDAPFIAWGPGMVPSGKVNDTLTDFTDMLPTFAELAGAELPEGPLDGSSIADVLRGQAERGPRQWIMAMGGGVAKLNADGRVFPAEAYADRVIRDRQYKLWVVDRKPARLYDLKADPAETNNLFDSNNPQVIEAKQRLIGVLESFPEQDAAPRYEPTPAQPWDRKR